MFTLIKNAHLKLNFLLNLNPTFSKIKIHHNSNFAKHSNLNRFNL